MATGTQTMSSWQGKPPTLNGSYRALRDHSKAAMLSAIEIYNKPRIEYRDEVFIILLVNAWELLFKAILSKNRERIFYKKERGVAYRTLSLQDAMRRSTPHFPATIPFEPVTRNLEMLVLYRNDAIHFYNQDELSIVVYGLAQTSIVNYRDIMRQIFRVDIAAEISLSLLPLSFRTPPDPIEFLRTTDTAKVANKAAAHYLKMMSDTTADLESRKIDSTRFLAIFDYQLVSVKKVAAADAIVGVKSDTDEANPSIVLHRVDPNTTYPYREQDIIRRIGPSLNGYRFSTNVFRALVLKYDIKSKKHYYWQSDVGGLMKYSDAVLPWLKGLTTEEIHQAVTDYRAHLRRKDRRK